MEATPTIRISPDEARHELARLSDAATAASNASTLAASAFVAEPTPKAATAKLCAEQLAANAAAALEAAHAELDPILAAESKAQHAALTARYEAHALALDARITASLGAMGDQGAAFIAAVHRVRDLMAERSAVARVLTDRERRPYEQVPVYDAARRMTAVFAQRGLADLARHVWSPEHSEWPTVSINLQPEDK